MRNNTTTTPPIQQKLHTRTEPKNREQELFKYLIKLQLTEIISMKKKRTKRKLVFFLCCIVALRINEEE